MNVLNDLIEVKNYKDVKATGFNNESFCVYLNNLLEQTNRNIVLVTNTLYEANKVYYSLSNYK